MKNRIFLWTARFLPLVLLPDALFCLSTRAARTARPQNTPTTASPPAIQSTLPPSVSLSPRPPPKRNLRAAWPASQRWMSLRRAEIKSIPVKRLPARGAASTVSLSEKRKANSYSSISKAAETVTTQKHAAWAAMLSTIQSIQLSRPTIPV